MKMHQLVLGLALLAAGLPAAAGEDPAAPREIGPAVRLVGNEYLEVDAEVNLRSGIIELVLTRQGAKVHESVLATPARPLDIHLGLLLLGLRDGTPDEGPGAQGDPTPPRGSPVTVTAHWRDKLLRWTENGEANEGEIGALIAAAARERGYAAGEADRIVMETVVYPDPAEDESLPLYAWQLPAEGPLPLNDDRFQIEVTVEEEGEAPGDGRRPERRPRAYPLKDFLFGDRAVSGLSLSPVERRARVETFVLNNQTGQTMPPLAWIFSGSYFVAMPPAPTPLPGQPDPEPVEPPPFLPAGLIYRADGDGSIITTFHDPASVLDNPLETGGDDTIYEAHPENLPPLGTPLRLVIRPASEGPQ